MREIQGLGRARRFLNRGSVVFSLALNYLVLNYLPESGQKSFGGGLCIQNVFFGEPGPAKLGDAVGGATDEAL